MTGTSPKVDARRFAQINGQNNYTTNPDFDVSGSKKSKVKKFKRRVSLAIGLAAESAINETGSSDYNRSRNETGLSNSTAVGTNLAFENENGNNNDDKNENDDQIVPAKTTYTITLNDAQDSDADNL